MVWAMEWLTRIPKLRKEAQMERAKDLGMWACGCR